MSQFQSLADYTFVSRKTVLSSSPQAPTTPIVTSLDDVENKQLEKLYKAIRDGDLPMVNISLKPCDCFHVRSIFLHC